MTNTLPDSLTHYTTIQGFMGIVDSKGFWASNASFLNDRKELVHGLEGAERAIFKLKGVLDPSLRRLLSTVIQEIKDGLLPATYVTCFCAKNDLLSQWRGYGGSEQGISIQFPREVLEKRMARQKAKLTKVIYSDLSTETKVREALAEEMKDLLDWENVLGDQSDDERKAGVFEAVSKLLPRFKHLGFQDEREWRFVVQHPVEADDLLFRPKGAVIAPYIVLGMGKAKLPMQSVTIGPGREMELTQASVRLFLDRRGYENVPVKVSRVPFRS
ncbi:DUF2971 domain-containing protein [Burkholderia contaminans]|uniref:DUF2971 domain-containing protein n=1 Tax=Burkholderia contaminans TaxID=488447 RepID=A0A3N8QEK5_9BURK|nr:DUF2971 domain-containing protein [Burkholderia contaminans]RQT04353.1 DUF2971 domain-containing protein [Burkholderia contaminans]